MPHLSFARAAGLCLLALVVLAPCAARPTAAGEPEQAKPSAGQTRIQKVVDELMPVVSALRGLPWKHPVPAKLLTRDELGKLLEAQLERDVTPEEWSRDTRILRRLGMLRADEDLRSLMQAMFQSAIAGLYDPETKQMYVMAELEGDALKPTIVHELIHALDDQHLDLEQIEEPYRDDNPDRIFAWRCLFEGGAEYARRRYLDVRPEIARAVYVQEQSRGADAKRQLLMMKRVPAHMLIATLLHYRIGPNFVTQALGDDFAGGMRRLYEDPPTTQEHCLHPYKWLGPKRDYPRTVHWGSDFAAVMGAGWSKLDEHTVGELDLAIYLNHFLGGHAGRIDTSGLGWGYYVGAMASRGARGWDAGKAYYLRSPGDHLVVIQAYAFDSSEEAKEGARFVAAALHNANAKSWKGQGWKDERPKEGASPDQPSGRYYDYVGVHGRGRVLRRGREVLVLDGIRTDLFDRLWTAVAGTRFEQDARDKGDEGADPFADMAVVDRRRGLGLKLPGPAWTGTESNGPSPLGFASAQKGSVKVEFIVVDQEYSLPGLPQMGRMVLGRLFDEKKTKPARIMGHMGVVHGLPAAEGQKGWIYIASDAARTYIVLVTGSEAEMTAARADVELLLAGCRPPTATPRAPDAPPEAGLRSVPGY